MPASRHPASILAERQCPDYLATVTRSLPPSVDALPTPALLLDLDVLESNLRFMQDRADALGVRLRPHVKTHKCLEIGRMQRSMGAVGITVSTLEEGRAFADHGFDDITWAFPLIGARAAEAARLAGEVDFAVTVDSERAVEWLEATGGSIAVWLEIDCGYGRSGVPHDADRACTLAARIADSARLELRGCLTHSGHAYHAASAAEIVRIAEEERRRMVAFGERARAGGTEPGALSVGSTPGMSLASDLEGIDEARPGNYALYDYTQVQLGSCGLERCAATVLASVVSTSSGADRAVTDCGALVLSKDLGPDRPPHFGRVFADLDGKRLDPEARVVSVSQEHALVSAAYPVGTKIRVLPNHSCLTTAQFDHFVVVRRNEVLDTWKIWRYRGPAELLSA